jgi:hypothetical protein
VKLTLPPRVSAAKFEQALRAFEGVVGKGWVLATDEDRDALLEEKGLRLRAEACCGRLFYWEMS